ncbi:MAG: S9 family peptidase [Vicinamibacteria bacterium]|nr:S9 family peptidase [Vicinamibacteria bacterium]
MTKRLRDGVLLALIFVCVPVEAQPAGTAQALYDQIDRIFQKREYDAPRFGPARWLPGGSAYAIVEAVAAPGKGREIVRYDAATGARSILVPASSMTPPGAEAPLDVSDYAWSSDGARLLIFTNTRKVWRDNTRGDYWVLNLQGGGLRKLGGDGPEASLMFAKFSPDGTRVGYVRGNNIYVERLEDGRITPLTKDGSETTINGTSDWVYEEELGVRDGFRWSPDGRHIAYWQFDTTGVGIFSLINTTDTLYPAITRIPYPKAGTTNSAVRIGVVSEGGGETRWLKTPGDPRDSYLARMDWVDASTVAIEQLNRQQNQNDFLMADAANGDVRRVFRDESKTWVDLVDEVRWIDGGRAFLWLSERDGWRHAYRVSREGGEPRLITRFEADVISVSGVDEAAGWLYFIASPTNATQQYLYRSKLDGSGVPERVTPESQPGSHSYNLAPGGRMAFHTYSRHDQPPAQDVVALPAHRSLRALTDVSALVAKVAPLLVPAVEFFTLDIGSGVPIPLDGWMLKPKTFDPKRRYPAIVYVYGEPASQTVTDRWGGGRMLFHRALADAGYIVVSFDNHGTPAPKGAAWRKKVYGSVGDLSSAEQALAVRRLAEMRPYIDRDRVGVWGWSGGGSNTLNAMFRFPDVFRVGVSVAPVPDQKLYDTIYQERYMGLPQENAEGYRIGSPINFAEGLKGNLLIVHGSGDDNVHYQGTERLINRLIALGKPFDTMVYPNRTHSISEGPGTTPHIHKLIARYFLDHLAPGPR